MIKKVMNLVSGFSRQIEGASSKWLAGVAVVLIAGVVAGGLAGYRAYDFVQHDNDFCMSCHLMADPFERFEASAHRGLSCKACHQPNPVQRAKMGVRQFVVNPTEIEAHAEVPNERCVHCHVDGDPEEWLVISASRGHELHLNSADGRLRGLECVTCHSESVHVFGASNAACTQSGCHDDVSVVLGRMADLQMPCVVCHDFVAPAPGPDSRPHAMDTLSMVPDAPECLSCHAMRDRLPADVASEPHGALCGSCHNAHDQTVAADATRSCTGARCHSRPQDIEDNHHRWRGVDLLECMQCHEPHDFRTDGDRCLTCHRSVMGGRPVSAPEDGEAPPPEPEADEPAVDESPTPSGGTGAVDGVEGVTHGPLPPPSPVRVVLPAALSYATEVRPMAAPAADTVLNFDHNRHRGVECQRCHVRDVTGLSNDPTWCASCHHASGNESRCASCHPARELEGVTREVTFALPSGETTRELSFPHQRHAPLGCTTCHGSPPGPYALGDCSLCHQTHHASMTVTCTNCHQPPPKWAHDPAVVHTGCTGAICHKRSPLPADNSMPRPVCLACHDMGKKREEPPADTATAGTAPVGNIPTPGSV